MKYFPLIWAGLWRKKLRTIFTLLSIVTAFLLFGMLQGVNSAFDSSIQGANLNRLYVMNKFSFIEPLPMSQRAQIAAVPGVTGTSFAQWFGGYYQDFKNQTVSFAIEPETYLKMFPEYHLPEEQKQAFYNTRTGVIVGFTMANKYGWKVGDKIPITSSIWVKKSDGTSNWTFDIVGIFDYDNNAARSNAMLLRYDYFDEERTGRNGTIGWFVIGVDDPKRASQIGMAVDALFANSPNETATQTEKENMQSFMKQIGDINFIVSTIIGAVFFTLLFLTGNTMMQSMRERIPEFAVLKTLGFSDTGVAVVVVVEAALLCVFAAVIGLMLANMSFPFMAQFLGIKTLPLRVLGYGILLALALSLVTALPPAWRVRRLSIVDALTRG